MPRPFIPRDRGSAGANPGFGAPWFQMDGLSSRIAVRVGRAVAALEAHLMRPMRLGPFGEEFRIECDTPTRLGVELYHPAFNAFGIELLVDGAIKRIGEVDAPPVATDLDHLWTAVERRAIRRMRRA